MTSIPLITDSQIDQAVRPASQLISSSEANGWKGIASSSSIVPITTRGIAPGQVSSISGAPFADVLTEAVGQVDQLEKQARTAVEGLMSGRGVDVHEAMIATEKAEMGFELMLSVRNKALSAYQQIVGMQF